MRFSHLYMKNRRIHISRLPVYTCNHKYEEAGISVNPDLPAFYYLIQFYFLTFMKVCKLTSFLRRNPGFFPS